MSDIFRPRSDPARRIYDAFQREAKKRPGRDLEEWQAREREAVLTAARIDWPTLPMSVVEDAEKCACGHVDYGAKWAHGIVRAALRRKEAR